MKPPPPLTQVEIIESSLNCFRLGLLGLLPLIGIPMAMRALLQYSRVRRDPSGLWNPAHRLLLWGGVCARLGLVIFLVIPFTLVAYLCLSSFR